MFDLGFLKNGPILDELSGVETLAYLDRFDPTDIEKNYIAGYFGLEFDDKRPMRRHRETERRHDARRGGSEVCVVGGRQYFPYALDVTNCNGQKDAGTGETDAGPGETDAGTSSGGGGKTW